MKLNRILEKAKDKHSFSDLPAYIAFCNEYLAYIEDHLQAVIVSQNENHYCFYQYRKEGNYQITRPIHSGLMYNASSFERASKEWMKILKFIKSVDRNDASVREIINHSTYTIQQSIGAALDALPAGRSNTARKLNGDLFERLVRLILQEMEIECASGVIRVPVIMEGQPVFNMSYQHDLIIQKDNEIKLIGSVKTSSKDRLGKIFMDKFLYNKLTEKDTPHIAVFLNDVQRKNTKNESRYGVNSTFLPGHFKAFSVKLNPLDGVYYCDIRPNMLTEGIIKDHIKTFDHLLIEDIWKFYEK